MTGLLGDRLVVLSKFDRWPAKLKALDIHGRPKKAHQFEVSKSLQKGSLQIISLQAIFGGIVASRIPFFLHARFLCQTVASLFKKSFLTSFS